MAWPYDPVLEYYSALSAPKITNLHCYAGLRQISERAVILTATMSAPKLTEPAENILEAPLSEKYVFPNVRCSPLLPVYPAAGNHNGLEKVLTSLSLTASFQVSGSRLSSG